MIWQWRVDGETFVGFGEVNLLYEKPRTASVQAVTDGTVWTIERQTFKKIVIRSEYQKRKMYETFLAKVDEIFF